MKPRLAVKKKSRNRAQTLNELRKTTVDIAKDCLKTSHYDARRWHRLETVHTGV
jgi:hypothetical protein